MRSNLKKFNGLDAHLKSTRQNFLKFDLSLPSICFRSSIRSQSATWFTKNDL